MIKKLKNIHPGEVLFEEFLLPMMISQNMLARDIGVSPRRINEIVHGKRAVTADTDLRLSKALGTSEGFWLGLQVDYDLEEKKISISSQLDKIQKLVNFDTTFAQNNFC
jgi:addiction module HigA family antidote